MTIEQGTRFLMLMGALGLGACDSDDGGEPAAAGSTTGTPMDGTTADEPMDTTGRPTPIPPDPDSGSGDPPDPTTDDGGSSGEPVELECGAYCELYMSSCQDFAEYANMQHCMDHCGQWPEGAMEDVDGDSLGCRIYHAGVASSIDAQLHCPHSGPSGAQVCTDPEAPTCDLYCTRYFNNCEGDLNLWADMNECVSTCASWYPGGATDTGGHSIGCRAYYANLAAADAETHCPNAGPGGGEACVLGQ
ncbi:MAG: hypothetical protein K0V04_03155 [Deltaproteobacteria bacterium]|nr:hypothetical protein [Deltaproteobacteria bacterium]